MEEFLRDQRGDGAADPAADFATPSESWRRAVELVAAEPPDLSRERRVKPSPKSPITDARHPFFWAGYLLVDCGPGIYPDAPPQPAAAIPVRPPVNPPPAPPQAAQ